VPLSSAPRRIERKVFFFEKKKQKTFIHWHARCVWRLPKRAKVFWFFFSKKNFFLPS
jgi:hypothetical protein